jgi:hypothetical protein
MNGIPSHYPHIRLSSNHHPSNLSQFPPTSLPANLLQELLRQTDGILNKDFYPQHQSASSFDKSIHYIPSPHHSHSPGRNIILNFSNFLISFLSSIPLVINTPVTSPHSNINTSQCSPSSSSQICNNTTVIINNGMQPSPATNSASSSCSSSSSSHAAPKKRFLNAMKQETQDDRQQPVVENASDFLIDDPLSTSVLKIVPDIDSPVKTTRSGFLIGTPSSTGTNSSSSTSSHTHFNYENVVPAKKSDNSTPSSFQWPSQFRRQLSLNIAYQTSNPLPSTPYTPPPMLSPFRKGPGLYYRVFSQPAPSETIVPLPTTPPLSFTAASEESAGPKINIGRDYQAMIPKLQTKMEDDDTGW